MKRHFNKLLFGNQALNKLEEQPHIPHFNKIRDVWQNSNYNDFGIERIFRLFLVTSKIFFPGVYLDYVHRKSSYHRRKITGELYVIFKTAMPFVMLYFKLWNIPWLFALNIYLLIETYVYIFHKIFLPEHNSNRNFNRSLILLFFNFTEVIGSYAVIYAAGTYFNQPVKTITEALYFSLITGATVGYGDVFPINHDGKLLVMSQLVSTLSFLLLFFNFFAPRAQDHPARSRGI
ncbi:ion channel [Daejeonella lutea]|uniref:Ion channel n=1 Tax=Daejeonella lutea TaxID=572036 RepID=A0A1T4ZZR7_9SPHI|nr:ion channel [Daejeonella lutea]SKB28095.1 Ion channel [Daejeonella lutea]